MTENTAVQPFDFQGITVRATVINGEPWLVAADVANALTLQHTGSALRMVDDEDRRTIRRSEGVLFPQGFGPQVNDVTVINESGVYAMIFQSNKPKAKDFRRWVTSEVLPAIRKTGAYVARPVSALDALQGMIDQLRAQEAAIAAVTARQDEADGRAGDLEALAEETEARVAAIEGRHDWFSALGYARLHGLPTSHVWLNRLGRTAGQIGRRQGLEAHKTQHSLFGEVNMWPEWIWTAAVVARRTAGDPEAQ